jgi:hypothetical protein
MQITAPSGTAIRVRKTTEAPELAGSSQPALLAANDPAQKAEELMSAAQPDLSSLFRW